MSDNSEMALLKEQFERLASTLEEVNNKCSELVKQAEQENWDKMWKHPLIPLEALDCSGWSPEERHEMRKKAETINSKQHKRCALCGSEVFVGASWMWNGMKGGTKPYFARCSKGGCKNVRPFLEGDTPEEAVQKWDETQTATRVALENMR